MPVQSHHSKDQLFKKLTVVFFFIFLLVTFLQVLAIPIVYAQTPIIPTLYCVGGNGGSPCQPIPSNNPSVAVNPSTAILSQSPISIKPSVTSITTINPCSTSTTNAFSTSRKLHKKWSKGNGGGFFEQLMQFFMKLIELLLGKSPAPVTGNPTPAPSTVPTASPLVPPTSAPCPSQPASISPSSPPVAATSLAPTSVSSTGSRDPLKQPFASTSIWNMPIGSGAVYVSANMQTDPGNDPNAPMPQIDNEHIVLKPTAPMTAINVSSVGWGGGNRCSATGGLLVNAPMPSNYIVANSGANDGAAFLLSDGRSVVQTQPLARCTAGGPATSLVNQPVVDLYGDGIIGAHGGSRLSTLGGTIRVGELRPGQQGPKHALKFDVYAKHDLYKCTSAANCYRWPAATGDGYAVGFYGTDGNNANTAMKMGSLLAIPASVTIASMGLESEPGREMAWTLQNYGAYIVDDAYGAGFNLNTENGPDGSVSTQFKADYGLDLEERVSSNTTWSRDLQKIIKALAVVNNNTATSIGGGGTPRQPLAPPIAP